MKSKRWIGPVLAMGLVAALMLVLSAAAPVDAQNTACFRPVGGASFECGDGGSFVVGDGATIFVESGGTLDVDSGATMTVAGSATLGSVIVEGNGDVTGNFEVTDHLLTQAELYLIPPDALAVTDGATITPTAAVMELTAAGAVGAELVAAGDGQLLILINTSANTITISDTATLESTGDIALGQYDTLTLMGVGVKWYQLAASNN